jgi:hypothetical protein
MRAIDFSGKSVVVTGAGGGCILATTSGAGFSAVQAMLALPGQIK